MPNIEVFTQGVAKNRVVLTDRDYIATGGEGNIYIKGSTVYKIIDDPKNLIPRAKLQELSVLTLPNIMKPKEMLVDSKGHDRGYTMDAVTGDPYTLCKVFTKTFRDREGLTPDKALRLVQELQTGIKHIHSKGILIVDCNEWNFMVDKGFKTVYFIDVNSYKTRSFDCNVLMPSVRDWHAKTFTELSDWFSFGVVAFQTFVGMHPFKGSYGPMSHIDKDDVLMERMKANISVFHKGVKAPGPMLPLTNIPDIWQQWFEAVFERGERVAPPDGLNAVIIIQPKIKRQTGSNQFDICELLDLEGDIILHQRDVTITSTGVYLDKRNLMMPRPDMQVGFTPVHKRTVVAWIDGGKLNLFDLELRKPVQVIMEVDQVRGSDGRIVFKSGSGLYEMTFTELPSMTLASSKLIGTVMEKSTQLFEGVAVQDMMGVHMVSLLPAQGECYQFPIPQLKGYRVEAARYENNVLMIVRSKGGKYDKLICRFSSDFSSYDVREWLDVTDTAINFTVLDSGIVVHINDNEEMEIFLNRKDDSNLKVVTDPALSAQGRMFHNGTQTLIAQGDKLSSITMRKS